MGKLRVLSEKPLVRQVNGIYYIDMRYIYDLGYTYTFVVGARGPGKTYGMLELFLERGIKFMHLRRLANQRDICSNYAISDAKKVADDHGYLLNITPTPQTKGAVYSYLRAREDDEGEYLIDDAGDYQWDTIGYLAALSTFNNVKGLNFQDVACLFFDEFIPGGTEKRLKDEFAAFAGAYETMSRNKELRGEEPTRVVFCANSNSLDNDILLNLGLVNDLLWMRRNKKQICARDNILIVSFNDPRYTAQKERTSLYGLTRGSRFYDMAINNEFVAAKDIATKSRPLKEYTPLCIVGKLCIYTHKSDWRYYVSPHKSGTVPTYGDNDIELTKWARAYPRLWGEYLAGRVEFEDAESQVTFMSYCHI